MWRPPFHRARDHPEFHEAAFERAVKERDTAGCGEAKQAGQAEIRGQEIGAPTGKALLEDRAKPAVEVGQALLNTHTDAIRRVRDENAFRSGRR